MVFGSLIGAGFGVLAGVGIGSAVFQGDRPKDYSFITEESDKNDNIRTPAAANITEEMRKIIPLTPEWTQWPDYDRWVMINRLLRLMWPKLTTAILKEIITLAKPILQQVFNQVPALLGLVEDITLGPYSLLDAEHLDPHILDKYLTMGDHPVRVAGMKVYQTTEDTCILETPILWGSNMVFDIQVYLKLGPCRVVVPISVSNVQMKAISRCVLNMVDTIPCIGGATVSLLDVPHFDCTVRLFNGPDLMALPGIKEATKYTIEYVVKQLALYPNSISVPLMTNFGVPADPQGMLHITLTKIENLKSTDLLSKGDAYVVFEVREGRTQRSKIVKNCSNPQFNEEFFMVVDDFIHQRLSIRVYDYDRLLPDDSLVGTAELFFTHESIETDPDTGSQSVEYEVADWIQHPMMNKSLVIPLQPGKGGLLRSITKTASGAVKVANTAAKAITSVFLGSTGGDEGLTTIMVAKKAKDVRAEEKRQQQLELVKESKRQADEKARQVEQQSRQLRREMSGAELAAASAQHTADAVRNDWTDDDEKALWDEWKRINDAKKAAAAAEAKRRKALSKEQRAEEDEQKKLAAEAKKAADEEIVLVEKKVALRGNGTPHTGKSAGELFITVKFMPFDKPQFDDDVEMKPLKTGLPAFLPFEPPPARDILTNVNDFQKGLLTVKILKAAALGRPGSLLSPDAYVEMTLIDCDLRRPRETQRSTVKYNDSGPRWLETFDFVMVSAGSILNVVVKDKTGILDATLSLSLSKARFEDKVLGRVPILVSDVARNGHLKDTWALQEAESGTIEMKLEWRNVYVDQYMD